MSQAVVNGDSVRVTGRLRALFACCIMLTLTGPASALQVEARLERDAVQLGEAVRLVIETDADPGQSPDLAALARDFHIVGRQRRSSMSVVNGQRRERHELVLMLSPKRAGLLEVPSISIGDAATAPLQLAVSEGSSESTPQLSPDLFPEALPYAFSPQPYPLDPAAVDSDDPVLVEASVEPQEVRVAQQAVLIARVLMPVPVTGPGLLDPSIDGARLLPLGEDWDQLRRDGRDYQVYERRYALFPERPGRLGIEPLVFEGWRQGPPEGGYPPRPEPVRALSDTLSLEVLPALEGGQGTAWLPARSVKLTELGPETYRVPVGQPLERVIEIRAEGMAAADLPALHLRAPRQLAQQAARPLLWDERTPTGVIGIRRETIRMTGDQTGSFHLPAVELRWWDTDSGDWKTARLPPRELVLFTAAGDEAISPPPLFEPGASRDAWTETPDRGSERSTSPKGAEPPTEEADGGFWVWATVALALTWLLTMAVWWGGRRRRAPAGAHRTSGAAEPVSGSTAYSEPEDPLSKAIEQVRLAYQAGETASAREALLAWAALALPDQTPANLALLAKRCPEPLRSEVLLLEQAFFSPHPVPWDRRRVWERLRGFEPLPPEEPASFRRKKVLRRRTSTPDTAA
jgi:hypothetical protein